MTNEKATRRYLGFLIPAALVHLGTSYAIKMADNAASLPSPALYAAAIVPVAAMLSMFWAHWRYVTEIDEFLRSIQIKAAFAALTLVMTVATGWGYLELLTEVPTLSIFWLNPVYWIAYSIAVVIFSSRYAAAS
jgi:hypothetical protein